MVTAVFKKKAIKSIGTTYMILSVVLLIINQLTGIVWLIIMFATGYWLYYLQSKALYWMYALVVLGFVQVAISTSEALLLVLIQFIIISVIPTIFVELNKKLLINRTNR